MDALFLGVDAGGTTTRALVGTVAGEVIGSGRAEGANVWSSGTSVPEVITSAIVEALAGHDPARVAASVIALAGSLTNDDTAEDVEPALLSLGVSGATHIVSDVLAGFATGTTAPDGTVLVAGTGSIAAAIRERDVRRTVGGHGWLLGDEGSAVWLGLEGLKAALAALQDRGPDTTLASSLPEALQIHDDDAASTIAAIVRAVHARPPAQLGRLAPVVAEAAADGDTVAIGLLDEAASHLVELAEAVIDDEAGWRVIVLSGSVLTEAGPISRSVRARLLERWPTASLQEARSGEAGAVALAIERDTGVRVDEATLDRLRASRGRPPRAIRAGPTSRRSP
jgi:N-acetylglucosamine kinase-like BadF-type ATPase